MKAHDVMESDEKFVKSSEPEAKSLFENNRKLIRPVVSSASRNPKVGAGWSKGEIKAVGLTRKQLRSLHLQIDKFRRTSHDDNIVLLKKIKAAGLIQKKSKSGKAKK